MVTIIIVYTLLAFASAYALTDTNEPETGSLYVVLAILPTLLLQTPEPLNQLLVTVAIAFGVIVFVADLWYTFIYAPRVARG